MTARLVNRVDGKWHIEIEPSDSPDSIEGPLFLTLGSRGKDLSVRMVGGLMLIEVTEKE